MLVRMWSNRNLTAGGNAKWHRHFYKGLAVPYKARHRLTSGRAAVIQMTQKLCPQKTYTQIFVVALFKAARN